MYWIYLVIFIIAVLIPEIVTKDLGPIKEERVEELLIFIAGILVFLIIYLKEKQLFKNQKEKTEYQKEVNRIFRNLKDSYSYIGEINRKLEILKNITLGLPEKSILTHQKEREIYDSIIEAIRTFGKTSDFSMRFINTTSGNTEREIKGKKYFYSSVKNNLINDKHKAYLEIGNYILICSPQKIDNFSAWIIINKKKKNYLC